jgi:hypothetical protein
LSEDNNITPNVTCYKEVFTSKIDKFFSTTNEIREWCIITIPEGSISNEYKIDLE